MPTMLAFVCVLKLFNVDRERLTLFHHCLQWRIASRPDGGNGLKVILLVDIFF
jgi:hypothetical protein